MEYKKVEGMSRGYDWEDRVASGWMAGRDGKAPFLHLTHGIHILHSLLL